MMLDNRKRIYALSGYTVEKRKRGWFLRRDSSRQPVTISGDRASQMCFPKITSGKYTPVPVIPLDSRDQNDGFYERVFTSALGEPCALSFATMNSLMALFSSAR